MNAISVLLEKAIAECIHPGYLTPELYTHICLASNFKMRGISVPQEAVHNILDFLQFRHGSISKVSQWY